VVLPQPPFALAIDKVAICSPGHLSVCSDGQNGKYHFVQLSSSTFTVSPFVQMSGWLG
jgi:hypothetical protein